jgi:hypothetical protein
MKTNIQSYVLGTASNPKTATQFKVNSVTYCDAAARADCCLLDASDRVIVQLGLIAATAAQAAAWSDDTEFAKVLAANAGFTAL